jgi:hypothetical protein
MLPAETPERVTAFEVTDVVALPVAVCTTATEAFAKQAARVSARKTPTAFTIRKGVLHGENSWQVPDGCTRLGPGDEQREQAEYLILAISQVTRMLVGRIAQVP